MSILFKKKKKSFKRKKDLKAFEVESRVTAVPLLNLLTDLVLPPHPSKGISQ